MPRVKRITLQNHYHLVVVKSSSHTQLFLDDVDFSAYLANLNQMVRDKLCILYAFCLQKNELRLVITPKLLSIARIMQRLNGSHTIRVNKRRHRKGPLFEGRFKSIIFSEDDLLNVVRSVHLWPVRSGLARRIENYPYSSYNTYSYGKPWNDFVETDSVLAHFSNNKPIAQKAFVRFVESVALEVDDYGVDETLPGVSKTGISIVSAHNNAAEQALKPRKMTLPNIAKRVGLLLNLNPSLLLTPSRRQDLVMARRLLATVAVMNARKSVTEVASFLNRDKAQISRLVSQGLDLIDINEPFKTLLDSLKSKDISHKLSKIKTESPI